MRRNQERLRALTAEVDEDEYWSEDAHNAVIADDYMFTFNELLEEDGDEEEEPSGGASDWTRGASEQDLDDDFDDLADVDESNSHGDSNEKA
jgi:hypothetical protein